MYLLFPSPIFLKKLFYFLAAPHSRTKIPPPGIEPVPPALEMWSQPLDHWGSPPSPILSLSQALSPLVTASLFSVSESI